MTDEELKKKAEEYSKDHNTVVCCDCSYYDSEEDIEEAYLAGAKELQKENEQLKTENEQLKQQIEKMKSCSNCKNYFKCENDKITNKLKKFRFPYCWELAE